MAEMAVVSLGTLYEFLIMLTFPKSYLYLERKRTTKPNYQIIAYVGRKLISQVCKSISKAFKWLKPQIGNQKIHWVIVRRVSAKYALPIITYKSRKFPKNYETKIIESFDYWFEPNKSKCSDSRSLEISEKRLKSYVYCTKNELLALIEGKFLNDD
jgi:hypothetical protein